MSRSHSLREVLAFCGLLWCLGAMGGCEDSAPTSDSDDAGLADADSPRPDAEPGPPLSTCTASEIVSERCDEPWVGAPVWIVAEMSFAVEDEDGRVPGFDLDGVITGREDTTGCGRVDAVSPSGVEGIDNQLASLWPLVTQLTGDAVDGLIQGAINEGRLLITVAVAEHTGATEFAIGKSLGTPLIGTDGHILADQTFSPDRASPATHAPGEWSAEGTFSGGGVDLILPINILDFRLDLRVARAQFEFSITPEGELVGLFGGGVPVDEFMGALDEVAVPQSLRDIIRGLMEQRTDLNPDDSGRCRSLSSALHFRAVPAWVADWPDR